MYPVRGMASQRGLRDAVRKVSGGGGSSEEVSGRGRGAVSTETDARDNNDGSMSDSEGCLSRRWRQTSTKTPEWRKCMGTVESHTLFLLRHLSIFLRFQVLRHLFW